MISNESKKYIRKSLYDKQSGFCNLCGEHFAIEDFTIDHVVAIAKGGSDKVKNLQLLCFPCNSFKADNSMSFARNAQKKIIRNKNISEDPEKIYKNSFYKTQKCRCALCYRKFHIDDMTLNLRVPESKGGSNRSYNLQLLCRLCETIKGQKNMREGRKTYKKLIYKHFEKIHPIRYHLVIQKNNCLGSIICESKECDKLSRKIIEYKSLSSAITTIKRIATMRNKNIFVVIDKDGTTVNRFHVLPKG